MTWHQPDFFSSYGGDDTAFVIERPSTNEAEADEAEQNHSKPSQRDSILIYLQAGNVITDIEALRLFQCRRLAARILELRKQGWEIQSRMRPLISGKRVAEYWLQAGRN